MSDEHEVTAGLDRSIGELLEHADRDRLPDTMLYFESHDGRNHVAVSAALMEEDDEEALRGFLAEECGTQDNGARGPVHSGLAERALPQRRACVA